MAGTAPAPTYSAIRAPRRIQRTAAARPGAVGIHAGAGRAALPGAAMMGGMDVVMNLIDMIDPVADAIGVVTAVFALWGWANTVVLRRQIADAERRRSAAIRVVLKSPTRIVELPLAMVRADMSRAELLGRIGMLPLTPASAQAQGGRFRLRALGRPEFLVALAAVQRGERDELVISADEAEIDQFDLSAAA